MGFAGLKRIFDFGVYEREEWIADEAKRIPAGQRVLDLGAGPCTHRPLWTHCEYKTQDFCQYEGSSVGPLADKGQWAYGHIDYVCDATSIPVANGAFDLVLCTEVMEHVPEPIKLVNEIARILRPGGKLLLSAPLGSGLHQEPFHFYGGFTPHWYYRFLSEAGFEQIVVTPNGGFFRHYGQESQRFSAWIDPRRVPGVAKLLLSPLWFLTVPWFRLLFPFLCHYLDRLDAHRGFTVGYHVSAVRRRA